MEGPQRPVRGRSPSSIWRAGLRTVRPAGAEASEAFTGDAALAPDRRSARTSLSRPMAPMGTWWPSRERRVGSSFFGSHALRMLNGSTITALSYWPILAASGPWASWSSPSTAPSTIYNHSRIHSALKMPPLNLRWRPENHTICSERDADLADPCCLACPRGRLRTNGSCWREPPCLGPTLPSCSNTRACPAIP